MSIIPIITEKDKYGYHSYDIASRLIKDRIIWIYDHIDNISANMIVGQMMILEAQDPYADINIFLNCSGGSVTDGLAIYDYMNYLRCDVSCYAIGKCASMGAVLLTSATVGKRYSFPNTEIMFHSVTSSFYGKELDVEISAQRTKNLNETLMKIIAKNCNRSFDEIVDLTEHDLFLTPDQALKFGAIDRILG